MTLPALAGNCTTANNASLREPYVADVGASQSPGSLSFSQLPLAVQKTVSQECNVGSIRKIQVEPKMKGERVYKIEFARNGAAQRPELCVAANGIVVNGNIGAPITEPAGANIPSNR